MKANPLINLCVGNIVSSTEKKKKSHKDIKVLPEELSQESLQNSSSIVAKNESPSTNSSHIMQANKAERHAEKSNVNIKKYSKFFNPRSNNSQEPCNITDIHCYSQSVIANEFESKLINNYSGTNLFEIAQNTEPIKEEGNKSKNIELGITILQKLLFPNVMHFLQKMKYFICKKISKDFLNSRHIFFIKKFIIRKMKAKYKETQDKIMSKYLNYCALCIQKMYKGYKERKNFKKKLCIFNIQKDKLRPLIQGLIIRKAMKSAEIIFLIQQIKALRKSKFPKGKDFKNSSENISISEKRFVLVPELIERISFLTKNITYNKKGKNKKFYKKEDNFLNSAIKIRKNPIKESKENFVNIQESLGNNLLNKKIEKNETNHNNKKNTQEIFDDLPIPALDPNKKSDACFISEEDLNDKSNNHPKKEYLKRRANYNPKKSIEETKNKPIIVKPRKKIKEMILESQKILDDANNINEQSQKDPENIAEVKPYLKRKSKIICTQKINWTKVSKKIDCWNKKKDLNQKIQVYHSPKACKKKLEDSQKPYSTIKNSFDKEFLSEFKDKNDTFSDLSLSDMCDYNPEIESLKTPYEIKSHKQNSSFLKLDDIISYYKSLPEENIMTYFTSERKNSDSKIPILRFNSSFFDNYSENQYDVILK